MKQKIFTIEEYSPTRHALVRMLALQLLTEEDSSLTLHLRYFHKPISTASLLDLADLVKELGREREFTVDVVLETDRWTEVRRHRKLLNRFSVRIELWPTHARLPEVIKLKNRMLLELLVLPAQTPQEFLQNYEKWKYAGLTVRPSRRLWSEAEFVAFFDGWLQDRDAVWLELLEDMATSILSGRGMQSCRHASCLGSRLYLDEADRCYFCSEKKSGTELTINTSAPGAIFDCEPYRRTLHAAIARREACRRDCGAYPLCKGGCPWEPLSDSDCRRLQGQIVRLRAAIEDGMLTAFVQQQNPCLRTLCLSLAAYGLQFISPSANQVGSVE